MKKTLLCLLVIFIFAWVGLRSLIESPFYTSHDGFTHTARIAAYYDTLKSGQFPPRWANNLNGNLGSPIFSYSYPLPYFAGSILHEFNITYEDSFRILLIVPYILSGLTAFLWLKNKFGAFPGLVGSIFYLWTPYRFLNIYVRGAIAENLAHTFLPLILLAGDKIFAGKKIKFWFIVLTLSLVLMFLSHNVVSAIFLPIFVLYCLLQLLNTRKIKRFLISVFAIVVSFFLSGFIYLPDLFELGFVRFSQGISYYTDHFVSLGQLIYSPWGYGFDLPGFHQDGLSFQLGLANLLLLVCFMLAFLIRRKDKNHEALFFIALFLGVLFLVVFHPLSRPIWQAFPVMKSIVDFPWRFLGLGPLIFAFFAAYTVRSYKIITYPLGILLLVALVVANRNHLRVNEVVTYGDAAYDNYTGSATATSNEYTPFWHNNNSGIPHTSPKIALMSGDATFKIIKDTPSEVVITAVTKTPSELRINRFFFPETNITGGKWEIIKNRTTVESPGTFDDSGTIRLFVSPPGGTYHLTFSETPLRSFANLLSLVTLIVLILFYVSKQKIH